MIKIENLDILTDAVDASKVVSGIKDLDKLSDSEIEKLHKLFMLTLKDFYPRLFQLYTRQYKNRFDNKGSFRDLFSYGINLHNNKFADIPVENFFYYCDLIRRIYHINKNKNK